MPPFGILVNKWSAQVKNWFRSLRIPRRDAESWADAKEGGEYPELNQYWAEFRANHPFFSQHQLDFHAMLGGWTLNYPSGSNGTKS